MSGGYLFECQHGAKECKGNKIQGCALDLYNISTAATFINCDLGSGAPADDDNLLKVTITQLLSTWIFEVLIFDDFDMSIIFISCCTLIIYFTVCQWS